MTSDAVCLCLCKGPQSVFQRTRSLTWPFVVYSRFITIKKKFCRSIFVPIYGEFIKNGKKINQTYEFFNKTCACKIPDIFT